MKIEVLRQAYLGALEQRRGELGELPTIETLEAFANNQLSEAEADRVRFIVSHYPDLARATQPTAPWEEASAEGVLSAEEMGADWKQLLARMQKSSESLPGEEAAQNVASFEAFEQKRQAERQSPKVAPQPVRSWARHNKWAAAAMLLLSCGLGYTKFNELQLKDSLKQALRPKSKIEERLLSAGPLRSSGELTVIELDQSSHRLSLRVKDLPYETFRAEISQQTDPVWSEDGLIPVAEAVAVDVHRGFFDNVSFRLELYGEPGGNKVFTQDFVWLDD